MTTVGEVATLQPLRNWKRGERSFAPSEQSVAWILVLLFALGCQPPPSSPKDSPPTPLAAKFNVKDTGSIRGQVKWLDADPKVEPIKVPIATHDGPGDQPNPNAPTIDPMSRGVAGALVFLRKVDTDRSCPWPHAPVTVAFDKSRLDVRQGKLPSRVGIVRRGESIACIAHEKRNHVLEGRGASVFSLPLLEPDKATKRKLDHAGTIELTSGSAFYWLRGHLWIGDHPYATLTDAVGRFDLTQVPAGDYELVCWLPNWRFKRRERNPENGEAERLIFEASVERSTKVTVRPDAAATVDFQWRDADFAQHK